MYATELHYNSFTDGASQVTSLLQAAAHTYKRSIGSMSDSGVGKSTFDNETKSLLSKFTEVRS